jgi:serine/threonine-protein kinase RsbW
MPNQKEKVVNLSIRNRIDDLDIVRATLDRVAQDLGIPNKAVMQLQVALDEILSNVVKYAWPAGEAHELHLSIKVEDGGIEVIVVDDGTPFDPRAHVPGEPAPGSRPKPGGVGIQMVRQLVDSFDYARIEGRNQVSLIKRYAA